MAEKELSILVRAKGAATAARDIGKVDSSISKLGRTATSSIGKLAQTGEKGLGHLKDRLTGLAGPLGLIGVTAGLFTVAGALEQGISKSEEMALAVEKLTGVTGLSAHAASQLVAVFGRFGIETDKLTTVAGFAEKTLGKLAATSKLAALDKTYGLSLVDSKGKVVDFAQELNQVADFYNSSASASSKAAVAAQLFGKGYVAIIPVLKLGSKGIAEVAAKADELGLTLKSAQDVQNVHNFISAQRDAKEAVGGLEVQLGLLAMPDLTTGLKGFTTFVATHHEDIKQFFGDAIHTAEKFAGFITGSVVPAISGLASAAKGFWDSIPPALRDLLFKGVVADRTINFLFGMSPIHFVADVAEGALSKGLGGILGALTQRGSSPANPVFVAGTGIGGGGLPGALPEAAGGAGALGIIGTAGIIAAAGVGSAYAFSQLASGPQAGPGAFTPTIGGAFAPKSVAASDFEKINWAKIAGDLDAAGKVPPGTLNVGDHSLDASEKAQQRRNTVFTSNPTRNELRTKIAIDKHDLEHATGKSAVDIGKHLTSLQNRLDNRIQRANDLANQVAQSSARAIVAAIDASKITVPAPTVIVPVNVSFSARNAASAIQVTSIRSGTHPGGGGPQALN